MTVLFIPQAQYRLDDAIFWLKGWAAANADKPFSADAEALAIGLKQVRDYLERLMDGSVTFLTSHAVVVDVLALERMLECVTPEGKIDKSEKSDVVAGVRQQLKLTMDRHNAVHRQISMHQLNQHRPWSLPGSDETIPF